LTGGTLSNKTNEILTEYLQEPVFLYLTDGSGYMMGGSGPLTGRSGSLRDGSGL